MQNIKDESFVTIYHCTEIDVPNWISKCKSRPSYVPKFFWTCTEVVLVCCTEVVHHMYRNGHVPNWPYPVLCSGCRMQMRKQSRLAICESVFYYVQLLTVMPYGCRCLKFLARHNPSPFFKDCWKQMKLVLICV